MRKRCNVKIQSDCDVGSHICGSLAIKGSDFCGIHLRSQIGRNRKKLRAQAGEMGVELAKWIVETSPKVNAESFLLNSIIKAQAVLDKLEAR